MKQKLFKPQTFNKLLLILTISVFIFGCKKDSGVTPQTDASQTNAPPSDVAVGSPDVRENVLYSIVPITSIPAGSYDITNSLPAGYVKNGTKDYTSYIQAAVTKYANVTFPAFPILVNDAGILVASNKVLNFLSGSQLWLKPSSKSNYDVLRIDRATNVTLNNPVIVGDATKHLGTAGEWGNGISILSSSNITVNGPKVTYCWGDGMYLGTSGGSTTNTNIKISNAYLESNRRDGMSITSANGLILESPYAGYSTGASPKCGINFEPSNYRDELQNIVVNNPSTAYNAGNGIQIGYSNLYGGSNKKTSINIINHIDKKSNVAIKAAANISKRIASETITGVLNITAPYWRQNPVNPIATDLLDKNIRMNIAKPGVQSATGAQLTQAQVLSKLTYKTAINAGANYGITF